jgi:hypothetical protein
MGLSRPAIDSALERRMYHCPMPDPKVLNAVAPANAPLAYGPPPASERHLDAVLTLADGSNPPADPAFAERFPRDGPLAAMSLEVAA